MEKEKSNNKTSKNKRTDSKTASSRTINNKKPASKVATKTAKQKGSEFKLTIISLIAMMVFASFLGGLIGAIMQNIFFQNNKDKKEENKEPVEKMEPVIIDYSQYIDTTPEAIMKNAEWMYEGLVWLFEDSKEIESTDEKMFIGDGKVYIEKAEEQKEITSITGNVRDITTWGEQAIERVYAITEDGEIWESICNAEEGRVFSDNFKKLEFSMKVINMTNGDPTTRAIEPPYFLLESGDLINKDGDTYDKLDEGYVGSFGDDDGTRTYISDDAIMAYYDEETKEYIPLTDEEDFYIIVKDAFLQKPSERNNVTSDEIGKERLYVIDQEGILYYYDFKGNNSDRKSLKRYEPDEGRKVQVIDEIKQTDAAGEYTNIKLKFDKGETLEFIDVTKVMN